MAFRTWVRLLLATLGVGALAGASQLGVAYGLGIVRLTRVVDVTTRDQWTAQLAWVAWFAMTAAVVGALAGSWLLPRWSPTRPGTGTIVAIALAAGVGAAVVVPLTMQPARTAQVAGVHPVFVIGVCAGLGALVGIFAAVAALMQPVSRWSLSALGIAVWVLAIVSVAPSLAPDDPLPAVRLGVFDAGFLSPGVAQRAALFTMPALALVAGALLGWSARRQDRPMLTIALAGLPGPALLTMAYLIAGPGAGADRYQVVPYWAAMTATGAGVLGSVLAAVLRRGVPGDAADDAADDGSDAPTADRPPLPRRTGGSESAIARAGAPRPDPADDPDRTEAPGRAGAPGPRVPSQRGTADPASGSPGSSTGASGDPSDPFDGPAAEQARPGRSRRWGRRAAPADASATGPGEWPTAHPETPSRRPQTLGDSGVPAGAPANRAGQHAATEPKAPTPWAAEEWPAERKTAEPWPATPAKAPPPYVPAPATRPLPPEVLQPGPSETPPRGASTRLGRSLRPFSRGHVDHPTGELDLPRPSDRRPSARGAAARGTADRAAPDRATGNLSPADRPAKHNAEAVAASSPEEDAEQGSRKRRGWRRGKASEDQSRPETPAAPAVKPFQPAPEPVRPETSRPFAGSPVRDDRTPAGRPLAAEPQTISAPLPQPEPVTPPIATPEPVLPPAADKRRSAKQSRKDDEYVDWVSGLGGE